MSAVTGGNQPAQPQCHISSHETRFTWGGRLYCDPKQLECQLWTAKTPDPVFLLRPTFALCIELPLIDGRWTLAWTCIFAIRTLIFSIAYVVCIPERSPLITPWSWTLPCHAPLKSLSELLPLQAHSVIKTLQVGHTDSSGGDSLASAPNALHTKQRPQEANRQQRPACGNIHPFSRVSGRMFLRPWHATM
jgi:hypothetical protein